MELAKSCMNPAIARHEPSTKILQVAPRRIAKRIAENGGTLVEARRLGGQFRREHGLYYPFDAVVVLGVFVEVLAKHLGHKRPIRVIIVRPVGSVGFRINHRNTSGSGR